MHLNKNGFNYFFFQNTILYKISKFIMIFVYFFFTKINNN